jgi:hypothetical protein
MQHREDCGRQLQQSECVRHRGAIAPNGIRDVLLRQIEFREQPLIAPRFVHGRQVVAL